MIQNTYGKYHNYGNSFIVLDETQKIMVPEPDKKDFSIRILNPDTGIGADGLVVLSSPVRSAGARHTTADIDCIFRHFEPDGSESLLCLNGLLVSGLYLSKISDKPEFTVLAGTNASSPQVLCLGKTDHKDTFVEGLHTSRVDKCLADPGAVLPFLPGIDKVAPLELNFRKDDIAGLNIINSRIHLSGYLVFSGEPHLIVFTDQMKDQHRLTDLVFHNASENRRSSLGDRLINAIGMRLQNDFVHLFPKGLNLTFLHLCQAPGSGLPCIEYRCFERAINKETLSCGTAALACSAVVHALNLADIEKTPIYPYRYNRHHPNSFFTLSPHTPRQGQWRITGKPEQISDNIHFL